MYFWTGVAHTHLLNSLPHCVPRIIATEQWCCESRLIFALHYLLHGQIKRLANALTFHLECFHTRASVPARWVSQTLPRTSKIVVSRHQPPLSSWTWLNARNSWTTRHSNISISGPGYLIGHCHSSNAQSLIFLFNASLFRFYKVVNSLVRDLDRSRTLRHVISNALMVYFQHFLGCASTVARLSDLLFSRSCFNEWRLVGHVHTVPCAGHCWYRILSAWVQKRKILLAKVHTSHVHLVEFVGNGPRGLFAKY